MKQGKAGCFWHPISAALSPPPSLSRSILYVLFAKLPRNPDSSSALGHMLPSWPYQGRHYPTTAAVAAHPATGSEDTEAFLQVLHLSAHHLSPLSSPALGG